MAFAYIWSVKSHILSLYFLLIFDASPRANKQLVTYKWCVCLALNGTENKLPKVAWKSQSMLAIREKIPLWDSLLQPFFYDVTKDDKYLALFITLHGSLWREISLSVPYLGWYFLSNTNLVFFFSIAFNKRLSYSVIWCFVISIRVLNLCINTHLELYFACWK